MNVRCRCQWVLLVLAASPVPAATDYAGPQVCRPCHPAEYSVQSRSHHALALRPILETPLSFLLVEAPIRERSGIAFEYKPRTKGLLAVVSKGSDHLEAVLEWAFGSGAQAYTPVGVRNGRYFEHRVSFYTSAARPGRTLGHPAKASLSLESALGIVQNSETIYRCFNCHATGAAAGPDLTKMHAGVTCERCHNAGTAHIAAVRSGQSRMEVLTPGLALSRLKALESVSLCAECHRGPASGSASPTPELEDSMSIRFQPLGLMASACFRKSGTMSCITCHNPHEDARRDAVFYVAKCLACHEAAGSRRTTCGLEQRKNCLPCHMQRRSPAEFLTFTDHRIRVYQ